MCGLLLVGVARAFGMVGHACARGVKSLRRKAKHMYYVEEFENVSAFSNHTEHEIWSFLKMTTLFASLGVAALSHTYQSRRGLHGVVAAFMLCFLFCFFAPGS